ncbi:ADP-ribosylglycohydrolase family protein [Streptomyces sp. NPDC008001]|uniref:ADP-ribosylglycohydrolase family protein n=1 Tax=Streptomyces sp. NPDC008001 TaxID=3364804 RepID=UPI0036E17291
MNAELHPWSDRARGMLVGAAVGDAMGWPYERRDRTRSLPPLSQVAGRFFPWQRLAGSRFRPLPEDVGAGEYSDDTQLLIAVARARLTGGDAWLPWLQHVELPFLLDYERGAGASIKRACRAWSKQGAAWGKRADDQERYFNTGANGAAMRIAPHVIAHHRGCFDALAADVIRDAVTTHGHPRALLGALVHAYALWISLRQPAPLAYGWLIEATLDGSGNWREPVWRILDQPWLDAAARAFPEGYDRVWEETAREMEDLLNSAHDTLGDGALSAPSVFLDSHGLTRTKTRGSGTLCAAAAIYLAARSAAAPERGITIPARQEGADTDTLASMTGSLLGAGLGHDWLGFYGRTVQDRHLLVALADDLLFSVTQREPLPSRDEAERARRDFREALDVAGKGDSVLLPDRRRSRIVARSTITSGAWSAERSQLLTEDGQNIFIVRGTRRAGPEPVTGGRPASPEAQARLQGAYVPVADVGRVKEALTMMGLSATQHGDDWVSYDNLVIRQRRIRDGVPILPEAQLRLAIDDTATAWERVRGLGLDGDLQRDGKAFWVRIDPYLIVAVNNAALPAQ